MRGSIYVKKYFGAFPVAFVGGVVQGCPQEEVPGRVVGAVAQQGRQNLESSKRVLIIEKACNGGSMPFGHFLMIARAEGGGANPGSFYFS